MNLPSRKVVLPPLETLLIAAAGGITFAKLGIPAGLVSGSVLAVAIAALAGRQMRVPTMVQRVCFVLVGILLGAIVTPETLKGMVTYPLSIAVLAVATIAMIAATTSYLRFVHGWDWASAFLGASPGAMAQVVALSAEFKADLRGVAIVQVMRVLLIMIGLPGSLALAGLWAGAVFGAPEPAGGNSLLELAVLVVVSTALALFLRWIKFPGGLLFGAMAGSAHPARHRMGPRDIAVVARRRRGDRDRRRGGLALLEHELAHGGRLSRRGAWIVRGRRDGRGGALPRWSCCCCRSARPTWSSPSRRARRTR